MRLLPLLAGVLMACGGGASQVCVRAPAKALAVTPPRAPNDANDLTFALLRQDACTPDNVALSGFVTREAVGMLGYQRADLGPLLGYPAAATRPGPDERRAWAAAVPEKFTSDARVFHERASTVDLDLNAAAFGAQLEAVTPNNAPMRISDWLRAATGGQLVEAPAMRAPVVSMAAFGLEMRWAEPFAVSDTENERFTLESGSTRKVPMMHTIARAGFGAVDDALVLDLPLGDPVMARPGHLSVLFVLPGKGRTVGQLEGVLDRALYDRLVAAAASQIVDIRFPRFSVTTALDLQRRLEALDRRLAFGQATLAHEVTVKVDESGIRAAAVAGGMLPLAAVGDDHALPPRFVADRPFLFFVHDSKAPGAPVLVGGHVKYPSGE